MKRIMLVFILMVIFFSSCGKAPVERPADFSLIFEWDTGALPPQYHYAYLIRIGPGQEAEFIYSPGYEPLTQPDAWRMPFEMSAGQLDDLYALLLGRNMLRSNWKTGQPLLGGSGTRLEISAGGAQYQVPSLAVLAKSERDTLEGVIEEIREMVPMEIWEEMDVRQSRHEADFEY